MCSASDDRSIRLWQLTFEDQPYPSCDNEREMSVESWENCSCVCVQVLYGHSARVWDVRLLSSTLVSVGEVNKYICNCSKNSNFWGCFEPRRSLEYLHFFNLNYAADVQISSDIIFNDMYLQFKVFEQDGKQIQSRTIKKIKTNKLGNFATFQKIITDVCIACIIESDRVK